MFSFLTIRDPDSIQDQRHLPLVEYFHFPVPKRCAPPPGRIPMYRQPVGSNEKVICAGLLLLSMRQNLRGFCVAYPFCTCARGRSK